MKSTKMIFQKNYEKREDILYEMADKTEKHGIKIMAKCSKCKKNWKIKNGDYICPVCGHKIKGNAVNLKIDDYKFYNASTTLFVDAIENNEGKEEIIATISMVLLSAHRLSGRYYPTVGEEAVRLKIRYNLTKRTALMYLRKVRESSDQMWMNIDLNYPFINLTQPTMEYLIKDSVDVQLPEELIRDLLELMNVDIPENEIKNIDLYALSWINRVRDYDNAMWQKSILTILSEKTRRAKVFNNSKEYRFYNRAANRVKRYLASNHKPKNYDEKTFTALCSAFGIERDAIPKQYEKYYYLNPYAIKLVKEHNVLFHNRDIRINAIKSAKEDDFTSQRIYNTSNFRKEALDVFGTEKRIYKKIEKTGDFPTLYDTVKMISKIKKSGYKIKTKGSLYTVHDRASKMVRYVEAPDVVFSNTRDEENVFYIDKKNKEEYEFVFAKTPKELILLGDKTNTCVGSYYRYCINGDTIIVYIKKDNEPVGILEIAKMWNNISLIQAKGQSNQILPINIQRLILDFCLDYRIFIDTQDIFTKLSLSHNQMLNNYAESTCLTFEPSQLNDENKNEFQHLRDEIA